jgi:hypothetical protein
MKNYTLVGTYLVPNDGKTEIPVLEDKATHLYLESLQHRTTPPNHGHLWVPTVDKKNLLANHRGNVYSKESAQKSFAVIEVYQVIFP